MSRAVNITEPYMEEKFSIFTYGFRPFFLLAGIYAIVPIIPWILYLSGNFETDINLQIWHAHEMLFGFISAALSGFLLTAVPNWTGAPRVQGNRLKLLVSLWLLGRAVFWLVLFTDNENLKYLLFLDLLLLITQGTFTSKAILFSGNKKNFILVGILAVLALANLLIILEMSGVAQDTARIGTVLAPNIILLMLAVIGGRVTPNFTRSYFQNKNIAVSIKTFPLLEVAAIGILVLNTIADLIMPDTIISAIIVLLACFIHAIRFSFWQTLKTLNEPILWVLHLGYLWIITTLFLKGAERFIDFPYHLYIHAFALGAVGTYVIGVMSRAALGHTGRPLLVNKITVAAYVFISAAALLRIIVPFGSSDVFTIGMGAVSILWIVGFSLYLWVYAPILTSPRIDGKSG